MDNTQTALTPLERLQLREALQDRWRDEVRRITELSVILHTPCAGDDGVERDDAAVAVAVSAARLRLTEIEQAMRRLDERSYGRCFTCLGIVPFATLMAEPETRHCDDCRPRPASVSSAATAAAG